MKPFWINPVKAGLQTRLAARYVVPVASRFFLATCQAACGTLSPLMQSAQTQTFWWGRS